MTNAFWLIIETVGSLLATVCVLRAYAYWAQIHPRDTLMQFVIAVTDWIVRPLRRVVPPTRSTDWASLLAALVIAIVLAIVYQIVFGALGRGAGRVPSFGAVVLLAFAWLIRWSLYLLMGVTILQAVISWINPHAPLAPTLAQLTRPFLAPLRRVIPPIGNVDITPLILILLVNVLLELFRSAVAPLFAAI